MGLIGGKIIGHDCVGGIVGLNHGTVRNCYTTGDVTSYVDDAGGIAGINGGTVLNCYATGDVYGYAYVGGIAGSNSGTVQNCYATGDVSGSDIDVGGIVGGNYGTVRNCYATSAVDGGQSVGGIAGENGSDGKIFTSYYTGTISADYWTGSVVGYITGGVVENCFSDSRSANAAVGYDDPDVTSSITNVLALDESVYTGEDALTNIKNAGISGFDSDDAAWVAVSVGAPKLRVFQKVNVPYVDAKGNTPTDSPKASTLLYSGITDWGVSGQETWYAVDGEVTFAYDSATQRGDRVTVHGNVNLILCDGATLTVPYGITVSEGNSLTIWRQTGGTGKLYAGMDGDDNATAKDYCTGIGGGNGAGGKITINGGEITVKF